MRRHVRPVGNGATRRPIYNPWECIERSTRTGATTMYKRPAHVLLLHPDPERIASLAAQAVSENTRWLIIRVRRPHPAPIDEVAWADLIISPPSLDTTSLAGSTPQRHWSELESVDGSDDPAGIRRRIQGMVGGLRMLARIDAPGTPTDEAED